MGEQPDDLEKMMSHLGEWGKYQLFQFLLLQLSALTAGIHMLSLVPVTAVPPHRCAIPGLDNGTEAEWNSTEALKWIPSAGNGLSSCLFLDPHTNSTSECEDYVYDHTYHKSSRAIDWDFVCGQRWMGAVSQSSYMFGVFVGAVTLGALADRYGRKTIFYISAIFQLLLSTSIAFVSNYYLYLVLSMLYGVFGSAGAYITGFVLTMELVGPSKRTFCGLAFQAVFAVGIMLVAIWGYLITNHTTLQLIYGLHSILLIGHWWLIDESPRWLWSQGRVAESVDIVARAVKFNGGPELDKAHFVSIGKAKTRTAHGPSPTIADMFKTPYLRQKTLNLALNWFANSLAYYGLSLNTSALKGNPYFILFIMGLIEVPGYFLAILLMDRLGRRFLTCAFMIIGSIACLMTAVIPGDMTVLSLTVVFIGKFCISTSFAIIYNYSAELFPTVLRNTGLGFGSMCARFSATLTPLITLLDSFDKRVPILVFASICLISGLLTMFLPETLDEPMPQSVHDGEVFGRGDTCFTTGCLPTFSKKKYEAPKPV